MLLFLTDHIFHVLLYFSLKKRMAFDLHVSNLPSKGMRSFNSSTLWCPSLFLFFCPCSCSYFSVLASNHLIILCHICFLIYLSFLITFSISSPLFNMTLKSCDGGTANFSYSCNMLHFPPMRLTSLLLIFNMKYLELSCYLQLQLQPHLIGKHSEERYPLSANQQ